MGCSHSESICLQTRHGDTYVACIGTCDMICAFKMKLRKILTSQEVNMLCPDFPQTLFVPTSLLVNLPETPNASHCFCLSHLCISDTLSMNVTIKLIFSNDFQKNSLTLNLDYVPYLCNSVVAHLHHNIYHTVL